jgi:hypothetical protein
MLKFLWQESVINHTAWNLAQVEEVDYKEYADMLKMDMEDHELDKEIDLYDYE